MRRARKVDANHAEVGKAFRKLGASTLDLSGVGDGCPDWLIAVGPVNLLIEVKDGAKSPSRRTLTKDQVDFHALWPNHVTVIETLADVEVTVLKARLLVLGAV